jgi:hypothetical protein
MAFPEDGAMDGVSDHEKGTTVTDHPFRARGEWWTVCETCGLARAAHDGRCGRRPVVLPG